MDDATRPTTPGTAELRAMADASVDLLGLFTAAGRCLALNRVGRAWLGVDGAALERVHLGDHVDLDAARARAGRAVRQGEADLRRADGEVVPVLLRVAVAVGDEEHPSVLAVSARDISEQRRVAVSLAQSDVMLRAMVANSSDIIAVVGPDAAVSHANPAITQHLGWDPADVIGAQALDFVHPDDIDVAADALSQALAGEEAGDRLEVRLAHADGGWRWFEVLTSERFDEPLLTGVVLSCREVTERHEHHAAVEAHARLNRFALDVSRQVLDHASDDLATLAPELLAGLGRLLELDACALDMVEGASGGLTRFASWLSPGAEVEPPRPLGPTGPAEGPQSVDHDVMAASADITRDTPARWAEWRQGVPAGVKAFAAIPIEAGTRLLGVMRLGCARQRSWADDDLSFLRLLCDILANAILREQARRELESSEARARALAGEMERRALHDPLTGLANRSLLMDRLSAAASRRARTGTAFSVLVVDLDGYKGVNDTFGHVAGDEALIAVAQRLTSLVRQTDTVARIGGDEFVLLCADTEPAGALAVAERVVQVLRTPIRHSKGWASIGASVGVSHALGTVVEPDAILEAADDALLHAKRMGKGRVAESGRMPGRSPELTSYRR